MIDALVWLNNNGGIASVNYHIGVIANGEVSPHSIKEFIRLERQGLVRFKDHNGFKRKRIESVNAP